MKHNWTYKKLGEVVKCYRGLTYSKADEVPVSSKMVLRSNNIDLNTHALNFDEIKCVREDLPIADDRKLKKDSIFICMSNGSMQHLGKVAYVDKDYDYAFGGFMGLIVPNPQEVFPKYVYYSLLAPTFLATILREGRGANINNLRFTDLENYSLPMPSKDEQQSIVRELDGINRLIDLQEEQLSEYDRLAQSLFYTTFGDPTTNPKGWEIKKLSDVVSEECKMSYGIVQPGDDIEDGVPVVRPIDFKDSEYIQRKGLKKTLPSISDSYKRTILRGDEILICVRGTTGTMGLATPELKGCNVTRGIVPLYFRNEMNKWFMYKYLKSNFAQNIIAENTYGATLKQINISALRSIPIMCPPLALQQTFAAQIEAIEQQKALIRRSLEHTRTLLAARMPYYFE